jgi:hypothetical protein
MEVLEFIPYNPKWNHSTWKSKCLPLEPHSNGNVGVQLHNYSGIISLQSLTKVHCNSTPLKLMEFIQFNSNGVVPLGSQSARDYNAIIWDVLEFIQCNSNGGIQSKHCMFIFKMYVPIRN